MMNIDKTALLTGWLMGRKVAAMMAKPRVATPIAYLYNGIKLPKLPDEVLAYPYQWFIYYTSSTPVRLYASDNAPGPFVGSTGKEYWGYEPDVDSADVCFTATIGDTEWKFSGHNVGGNTSKPTWTNVNAYKLDGTLLLAASEPIPAYDK